MNNLFRLEFKSDGTYEISSDLVEDKISNLSDYEAEQLLTQLGAFGVVEGLTPKGCIAYAKDYGACEFYVADNYMGVLEVWIKTSKCSD